MIDGEETMRAHLVNGQVRAPMASPTIADASMCATCLLAALRAERWDHPSPPFFSGGVG